ncbi:MAG: DUF6673 family protein [Eubacterium sp.]
MLKINDVDLNFDLMDAEIAEAAENALKLFAEKHGQIKRTKSLATEIRKECDMVYEFFDNIFGVGAADQVFKGEKHYTKCCNAFAQVVKEIKIHNENLERQNSDIKELIDETNAVQSPKVKRFEAVK